MLKQPRRPDVTVLRPRTRGETEQPQVEIVITGDAGDRVVITAHNGDGLRLILTGRGGPGSLPYIMLGGEMDVDNQTDAT